MLLWQCRLPFHITDLIFHLGHSVMFSAKALCLLATLSPRPTCMGSGVTAASILCPLRQDRRESRDLLQWCFTYEVHFWSKSPNSFPLPCLVCLSGQSAEDVFQVWAGASPKCYITWAGEEAVRIRPAILYFSPPFSSPLLISRKSRMEKNTWFCTSEPFLR